MSERCILIAAGGTGGHLFPAAALADSLARRGVPVELATDDRALRFGRDFPARAVHGVASATPIGGGPLRKGLAALTLARGFLSSLALVRKLRPRAVVGFGGYPTAPPILAASLLRVPIVLHEQNSVFGRANRFLGPRAALIGAGFPDLKGADAAIRAKLRYVGIPVRISVIEAAATPPPSLEDGRMKVLVTGGSQGARVMADVVPTAIALLSAEERARIRLTQQARGEDKARVAAACAEMEFPVEIAEFFIDLPRRIAAAHLVICRAGASTVCELEVIGRASILVPFPFALDQDQAANAAALGAAGGAVVVPQEEFTPERLAGLLRERLADPQKLVAAAAAAKSLGVCDASERLAEMVMEVAKPA